MSNLWLPPDQSEIETRLVASIRKDLVYEAAFFRLCLGAAVIGIPFVLVISSYAPAFIGFTTLFALLAPTPAFTIVVLTIGLLTVMVTTFLEIIYSEKNSGDHAFLQRVLIASSLLAGLGIGLLIAAALPAISGISIGVMFFLSAAISAIVLAALMFGISTFISKWQERTTTKPEPSTKLDLLKSQMLISAKREADIEPNLTQTNTVTMAAGVAQLLQHVARGEQTAAEAMLKEKPDLLLAAGSVTDLSGRSFTDITAFQYALWAVDSRMCEMLLKYMPEGAALQQYTALEEQGTAYGTHFDLTPLIHALNHYSQNFNDWRVAQESDKMASFWKETVGGEQLKVPAHIAQEYCNQMGAFNPSPDVKEEKRSESLTTDRGEWYDNSELGRKFAYVVHDNNSAWGKGETLLRSLEHGPNNLTDPANDAEKLQFLWKTRQQQLVTLGQNLSLDSLAAANTMDNNSANAGNCEIKMST